MSLLLLPKALGLSLLFASRTIENPGRPAQGFGQRPGRNGFSLLLAPILMLFHTRFVLASFTGMKVRWGGQKRDSKEAPSWRDCFLAHGTNTLLVLVWIGVLIWWSPALLP